MDHIRPLGAPFKSFAHNGKQVSASGEDTEEEDPINLIDVSGVINKDGTVALNPSYHYEGWLEDIDEPSGKGYLSYCLIRMVMSFKDWNSAFHSQPERIRRDMLIKLHSK